MPFLGVDPWRWQYFEHEPCPAQVVVPIDDAAAWQLFPRHRDVYNKLHICASQNLPHGPHGTVPAGFPVFSKPIYNMRGMGTGGHIVRSLDDYREALQPGHLWMPYLEGRHVSTDVVLEAGRPRWWRHTTGKPLARGTFDYWTVHAARDPALERFLRKWLRQELPDFTGIVNIETIGGVIIECHLRMSEQWLDLNGEGWLKAVVHLYAQGVWRYRDARRRDGYSIVLFEKRRPEHLHDGVAIRDLLGRPGISSIQITFDPAVAPERHAMPPGGFRLAIVNGWDLAEGCKVRSILKRRFRSLRA